MNTYKIRNHTWIPIAQENRVLVIEWVNNWIWIINGKIFQTTEMINNCCNIRYSFDLGEGKELVIFYHISEEEIGNVFYYDWNISEYEPVLTFKQSF